MVPITLVDHLRALGDQKASGRIRVMRDGGPGGEIYLVNGVIVHASAPEITPGPQAVAAMTAWDPVTVEWTENAPPPTLPQKCWCLELVSTSKRGLRLALEKAEIRIGRGPGNDVTVIDPSVSRNHCVLSTNGDRIRLLDPGSSNGTRVSGRAITDLPLTSGCEFRVGPCHFRLTYGHRALDWASLPVLVFDAGAQATELMVE